MSTDQQVILFIFSREEEVTIRPKIELQIFRTIKGVDPWFPMDLGVGDLWEYDNV